MEYKDAIFKFKGDSKESEASPYNRTIRPKEATSMADLYKRPAPHKWSTAENVAVAATPMLLGLLMGDVGTGAEYGAKGLLAQQKRELAMDKELRGYQMKQSLAKSKEKGTSGLGSKKGYITKEGKVVWKNPTGSGFIDAGRNVIPAENVRVYTPADMDTFRAKQEATIRTSKESFNC